MNLSNIFMRETRGSRKATDVIKEQTARSGKKCRIHFDVIFWWIISRACGHMPFGRFVAVCCWCHNFFCCWFVLITIWSRNRNYWCRTINMDTKAAHIAWHRQGWEVNCSNTFELAIGSILLWIRCVFKVWHQNNRKTARNHTTTESTAAKKME